MGDGGRRWSSRPKKWPRTGRIFPDLDPKRAGSPPAGPPGYLRRRILPEDANRVMPSANPRWNSRARPSGIYPQGSLAAHVLGFVGADGRGHVGMEQVLDERLTDPATRGSRPLSIDVRVQGALEDELRAACWRSNAHRRGRHRARCRYRRSDGAGLAARIRSQPDRRGPARRPDLQPGDQPGL
jgi:hypothetical protein